MKPHAFGRPYRFGLRTLLVLVIAIWCGIWKNKANRQRTAVKVISTSGSFVYSHEFPFRGLMKPGEVRKVDYAAKPPGPAWLRSIVGDDYFQTVRMVHFSPTDEAMKQLANLPDVGDVAMDAYQLTDEGFKQLSHLRNLENLTISNGHNLSNSMAVLTTLPRIRRLLIYNTPIDYRSVEHFAKLANLRQLHLSATLLSDEDVARLCALLPNASIDVDHGDPDMPRYQPPTGKPQKGAWLPYDKYRGTPLDPRRGK